MKLFAALVLLVYLVSLSSDARSFSSSKRILTSIYQDNSYTFYYKAPYSGKVPDIKSVGYSTTKYVKRSKRIEWEHIMPAYDFGRYLRCWGDGGRRICSKNVDFKAMEGDMHNLVPAIGSVNAMRSNKKFVGVDRSDRMIIAKTVSPPNYVRGDIARVYLYMSQTYNVNLSSSQRKQMEAWDRMDPVDSWECTKNELVLREQGNRNPFVTRGCN